MVTDIAPRIELFKNQTGPLYWANLGAQEKVIVNQGGMYSGKSYSIIQVLITYAIMFPNFRITVASNTMTKLREDAIRIFQEIVRTNPILRNYLLPGRAGFHKTLLTAYFRNGSFIEFKSFETPEQADGAKRDVFYLNEASRVPYMTFYKAAKRTEYKVFIDYNPTVQFWAHDSVINSAISPRNGKKEFPSVKVIRSWHVHNPFLTEEKREEVESIADPDLWRVYARGLTGKLKGTIYPNWTEIETFPWTNDIIWYLDWGYTNDPTAGGRIAVKPAGTALDFAADEFCYTPGIPMGSLAKQMVAKGYKRGQICYCDHDTALINEIRIHGIDAFPMIKGPGSILSGILFLKSKNVAYTATSENIRQETRKYRFLDVDGKVTNEPIDEWNHHLDGIRGAAHTYAIQKRQV